MHRRSGKLDNDSVVPGWSRRGSAGAKLAASLPNRMALLPTATGWSGSCRAGLAPAERGRLGTAHKNCGSKWSSPVGATLDRGDTEVNTVSIRYPFVRALTAVTRVLGKGGSDGVGQEKSPDRAATSPDDRTVFDTGQGSTTAMRTSAQELDRTAYSLPTGVLRDLLPKYGLIVD